MKRALFASILAATLFFPIVAEDAEKVPLRLMTSVSFSGASPETVESWAASLDAALARLERVGAVRRAPEGTDPTAAAGAAAYDFAVVVEAGAEASDGTVPFNWALIDAVSGKQLAGAEESLPVPRESALNQTFWLPITAAVETAEPTETTTPEKTTTKKDGARSRTVESALYMGQFADAWFAYAPFESIRLRAGLYQFLIGYRLTYEDDSAIVSFPLLQPGIGADIFLAGSSATVEFYLSVVAFVRLSGSSFFPDPIAPFGTTFMLGAERPVLRALSLFVELGVAYYPFCDGYLTAASKQVSDGGGPFTFAYGDWWYLEFPQFRLGARLKL